MTTTDSDSQDGGGASESSLYDRVGGEEGIEKLVGAFYDAVFTDSELNPFFHDVPKEKLKRMQRELFTAALDGPIPYSGRPLSHAHHGKGIRPKHMQRFVGHLFTTLEKFGISEDDRNEIISRINRYSDEVIGGGGLDA